MASRVSGLLLLPLVSAALLLPFTNSALGGTTGKLSGRILDEKKQPLPGVTLLVIGTHLGALTDTDGRYNVVNVPAGTYQVKVQLLGYRPVTVTDVHISPDKTTPLDIVTQESPVEMKEVVVSGKSPVVDVRQTGTIASISKDEIANLPVQELQDVVNLQAGVVDGHFRGGRSDEVQFQVDGVSVNNSYDNKSTLRIDRSLIEEVQVISGTFDAEYGQAMSGVVNAVLKRGTEKLHLDAESFGGGFLYPGGETRRGLDYKLRPTGVQNYQVSASGPTGLPRTLFIGNLRRYVFDDYAYGVRFFEPTDKNDFANGIIHATGDRREVPLGYSREWSGVGKVTSRPWNNIEIGYQAIFNVLNGRKANWMYRLNPDGLSKQHTYSIVHGLDWTHTLNKKSFYNWSLRQNYFNYDDRAYENLWDARYDSAGAPIGVVDFEGGVILQGVDFTRFHQNTNALVFKSSFVSQITQDQQAKAGVEFQLPRLEFGSPGYLVFASGPNGLTLVRHDHEPPNYPGLQVYHPVQGAAFAQEQAEWNDLTVRAGLRLDYFDARSKLPGDLANPANSISGKAPAAPIATTRKVSVSPRLGVSYPVSRRASIYFAYGHFYQLPGLGEIFTNADYSILADLAAGGVTYGVMGNPDLKPERTIQYQGGYKHAISEDLGLDLTIFYKDIRDLLGTEFISTYNNAEYPRLTNADFGNVLGFTVAFDLRRSKLLSGSVDYTWQKAEGNSSDPRETATRASAGEDPRPRLIPLNWDQRHTLNLTATLSRPDNFSASGILRAASGQPYTPTIQAGFGGGLEANSGRKPMGVLLDLRGEKLLRTAGTRLSAFARVFNVFDTRFFNGFVFNDTGSPFYSRHPEADVAALLDPTRFYTPRRVEVGVTFSGGR